MIDYEEMILARQEEEEEPEMDCRYCEYLDICRSDEEKDLPHICYFHREENEE